MKESLLEILACPCCGMELVLKAETTEQDEIVAGTLECSECAASFSIRDGVPCMLRESAKTNLTRQGFTEQWQLWQSGSLENRRTYGQDPAKKAAFLSEIDFVSGMKADDWILDAGCGPGDITYAVAVQNPNLRIVGLDFNDTIYTRAKQAQNYPNISFVHGDVMQPPFKASSFAGLYSWGVLHCTKDTRAAFETSASLVTDEGAMAVWIYPHPSESPMIVRSMYLIRDVFFMGKGHHIPEKQRFFLSQATTLLCSPAFAVALALDGLSMRKRLGRQRLKEVMADFEAQDWRVREYYRLVLLLVFDSITPEYMFRHSQAEVRQWFEENGFSDVQTHDGVVGYYWSKRMPPAATILEE